LSIRAELRDERGTVVSETVALVEFPLYKRNRVQALLRYIDPYGYTYFNHVQMEDFIAEWRDIEPTEPVWYGNWLLVLQMATRCKNTPGLLLAFIGD
jgi:hypothetical protein